MILNNVHPSWHESLNKALATMDASYLQSLQQQSGWLPGQEHIFAAFAKPKSEVNYILFGESPYPRAQSANGYAFWDASVTSIWSDSGLSRAVNRATSLRNFIKMLLVTGDYLSEDDLTQPAIAAIDKTMMIQSLSELFQQLLDHGFLLLNASLVLSTMNKTKEAKYWHNFMESILNDLCEQQPTLILFGKIAELILSMPAATTLPRLVAPHPYNLSFIHNKDVQDFFKPFHLLTK